MSHHTKLPSVIQEENYDFPRPQQHLIGANSSTLTPSSSNSSLFTNDSWSLSLSSSNRSSIVNASDYDMPKRNPIPVRNLQQQQQQALLSRANGKNATFLCTTICEHQQLNNSITTNPIMNLNDTKELPLVLSSAMETLSKLQTDTTAAITRFVPYLKLKKHF